MSLIFDDISAQFFSILQKGKPQLASTQIYGIYMIGPTFLTRHDFSLNLFLGYLGVRLWGKIQNNAYRTSIIQGKQNNEPIEPVRPKVLHISSLKTQECGSIFTILETWSLNSNKQTYKVPPSFY